MDIAVYDDDDDHDHVDIYIDADASYVGSFHATLYVARLVRSIHSLALSPLPSCTHTLHPPTRTHTQI